MGEVTGAASCSPMTGASSETDSTCGCFASRSAWRGVTRSVRPSMSECSLRSVALYFDSSFFTMPRAPGWTRTITDTS